MPSKLETASDQIFTTLKEHSRIITHAELQSILRENQQTWRLPQSMSVRKFIEFLSEKGKLKTYRFEFPHRPALRYTWGDIGLSDVVQSIQKKGYFSHFTAMQQHDLTEQVSKTIYFNIEQRLTGGGTEPTQAGIDRAFKGKCRISKNAVTVNDQTIRLLNGRNTGEMGVMEVAGIEQFPKRVTNIERTLIDITVRPVYSGGVYQVAQAFVAAQEQVDVKRLASYLRKLNFTYPYHQSIGFYMERAGNYSTSQMNQMGDFELQYDFYLDYGMKQTEYIKEWSLHVPKGF
ncbi:hypothetical protein OAF98_03870 [Planctomicrobium sp.]|nr:hypothetical protein [Planctomicrobium sp.]MDA7503363.1 hypothetical protein [bacterium]MDA7527474.1 hypothetical protein [bacterium]MDB4743601.1 hypothetical protein [Planctomicrobium sp.]